MKKLLLLVIFFCQLTNSFSQNTQTENVVLITLDGMRWQEVFGGADSLLAFSEKAQYNTKFVQSNFWDRTANSRREKLMPFFWSEIVTKGVLLGNRKLKSHVNTANPYWFSYPGYNEITTGFPDTTVKSNDKIPNKNESVFEYLNKTPEFKGKAAVFASWDVFASIYNEKRSGLAVNDGFRDVMGTLSEKQKELNRLQHEMPDLFHGSERLDVATFHMALEYMKENKPKLLHIAFGDTDEFAHSGMYDLYLDAAKKSDNWIRQLWEFIQNNPHYANKTTLIITTDHGRGAAIGGAWKDHGSQVKGASEIWIAAIGPGITPEGESKKAAQYQQGQVAATIAKLVGMEFKPNHTVLPSLQVLEK